MWKWLLIWLLILIAEIVMVPFFYDSYEIEDHIKQEYILIAKWFSDDEASRIYNDANNAFHHLFLNTGIAQATYALTVPDPENRTNDRDEVKLSKDMVNWFDRRIMAWWSMWLQALERLMVFKTWLPFAVVFFVPTVVDGWVQREIKKSNFGYASPVRYHFGMFLMFGLLFFPLLYSFSPFVFSPLSTPIWIVLSAFSLVMMTSNLQKHI